MLKAICGCKSSLAGLENPADENYSQGGVCKQRLRRSQLHRAKRTNVETKMRKSGPDQRGLRPWICKDRISKSRHGEGRRLSERKMHPRQIARGVRLMDCTYSMGRALLHNFRTLRWSSLLLLKDSFIFKMHVNIPAPVQSEPLA